MYPKLMKQLTGTYPLSRRELLWYAGATAVSALIASRVNPAGAAEPTGTVAGTAPACVVRPQQTAGPYFVDERLLRSDIRLDPSDGSVQEGVPVRLAFRVLRLAGEGCTPLSGAAVDIWHCDALGRYSDVLDMSHLFDTRGKKFLRGAQMTDAIGTAQFITIYPGWYPGRTVHIHFKIRVHPAARRGFEFTSQLYFDEALTDRVHAQAPYATKGPRPLKNDQDGLFRRGGRELLLQLSPDTPGYAGRFDIGLRVT